MDPRIRELLRDLEILHTVSGFELIDGGRRFKSGSNRSQSSVPGNSVNTEATSLAMICAG